MPAMTTATSDIHSSTVITGDVSLGNNVTIGPNCVLDGTIGSIVLGDGCRLVANVYLTGPLQMGRGNTVWPSAALGGPPQDVNYDPRSPGEGLIIGDDNIFREGFSAHRAKTDAPTRIGHHNYCMACSHVGHDSVLGDHIQLANGVLVAGHVTVGDRVIMGGNAGVHQFCNIGKGAFLQGMAAVSMDVPPWCIASGLASVGGLNLIGMRRSGMDKEEIKRRRDVYKLMFRSNLSMATVAEQLRRDGDVIGCEYADFIEQSTRGVCKSTARIGRRSQS